MTVLIKMPESKAIANTRLYGESMVEQARRIMNPKPIVGERGLTVFQPGVRLGLYPKPGTGTVSVGIRAVGGYRSESESLAGASDIISQAVQHRFKRHRAEVKSDPSGITFLATYTRTEFPQRLAQLLGMIVSPSLGPSHIEHARALASDHLSQLGRSANFQVAEQTIAALERARGYPSVNTVNRINNLKVLSLPQILAWYQAHVSDAPKDVVIVGDFDTSEIRRVLERGLSHTAVGPRMRPARRSSAAKERMEAPARGIDQQQVGVFTGTEWSALVWPKHAGTVAESLGLFEYVVNHQMSQSKSKVHRPSHKAWMNVSILADRVVIRFKRPAARPNAVIDTMVELAQAPPDGAEFIKLRDIYVKSQVIALANTRTLTKWLINQLRLPKAWTGPNAFEDWRAYMDGLSVDDLRTFAQSFVDAYRASFGTSSEPTHRIGAQSSGRTL